MSSSAAVTCPKCRSVLSHSLLENASPVEEANCPACRAPLFVATYPRFWKGGESEDSSVHSLISGEGDAVCRFYPELKAETVCEECGCFLSTKAAVTWNASSYCLPCLHMLREKKERDGFLSRRTLYDNTALGLVLFLSPLSLFTAPMALYYLIRYRNASRGIVPRGKFRWWLALLLSAGLLLGWLFLLFLWIVAIADSLQ